MNYKCVRPGCGRDIDHRRPQYGLQVTVIEDMGDRDQRRILAQGSYCSADCLADAAKAIAATQGVAMAK